MLNPSLYPTSNDHGSAPGKGETEGKRTQEGGKEWKKAERKRAVRKINEREISRERVTESWEIV
jgi:hypothetical protein